MNIWINIFLKLGYLRATLFSLLEWPSLWSKNCVVTTNGSQYPLLGFVASTFLYPPTAIELIGGQSTILFIWIVIIGLVNTIWGAPTTLVVAIDSVKFRLKFLHTKTPPNPLPKFVADPISIPPLTTFVLGATTVFTPVVIMMTLGDWVTYVLASCIWIATTATSNTLGEVKLTWVWQCPIF
jgi:small-conductance mechanosensitive channel